MTSLNGPHFGRVSRPIRLFFYVLVWMSSIAHSDVSLNIDIGQLRDPDGEPVNSACLWALLVAAPGEQLPGKLGENSSLSEGNIPEVRAAFGGSTLSSGANIGSAIIIATGFVDEDSFVVNSLNLTNEDYEMITVGSLIGLYWFPEISQTGVVLPDADFTIGGFQQSTIDAISGGNGVMVVSENTGQSSNIFFFDSTEFGSLPVSRFTAIEVPPSGYQIWRDLEFTQIQIDVGEADPTADPDMDGLENLLEYATSSLPLQANAEPLSIQRSGDSAILEFQRVSDQELRYRVEATDDLGLSPWPDVVFESSGSDNVEELVTHPEALDAGKRFFRLSVDSVL